MAITVTKTGPFFPSGPIKWSDLRNNFKETQSGPIKCSELWQNTNINDTNPIVPHCTENDQVTDSFTISGGKFTATGTSTNWKASLMRNSVKRYTATSSGVELELDMGLCTQVIIILILITVLYLDLKEKRTKWDTTKI